MLRTLSDSTVSDSELLRLCYAKSWPAVYLRTLSHPLEAEPSAACLQGTGSTVLSVAVRHGLSRVDILSAIVNANPNQITITHRHRGSILHEAFRHQASDRVLEFLLKCVLTHQRNCGAKLLSLPATNFCERKFSGETVFSSHSKNVSLQNVNILSAQDDMGRTALHCVVEQAKRINLRAPPSEATWQLYRKLLVAYPEACQIRDADGYTPLLQLLSAPSFRDERGRDKFEETLFHMVELMLSIVPRAVDLSRTLPRPWRFQTYWSSTSWTGPTPSLPSAPCALHAAPTPLYFALLHERSLDTVKLLLRTSRVQDRPLEEQCSSCPNARGAHIVTPFHEVGLHIAVTTGASLPILREVVQNYPTGVLTPDRYGLTALDWLWLRYVVDSHAVTDGASHRIISRRRHLPNDFIMWYKHASLVNFASLLSRANSSVTPAAIVPWEENNNVVMASTTRTLHLLGELVKRMQLLLPVAAATATRKPAEHGSSVAYSLLRSWTTLDAACFLNCPNAMVRIALLLENGNEKNDSEDNNEDNNNNNNECHPGTTRPVPSTRLHLAAARRGYRAPVPIGATRQVQWIREPSAVWELLPRYQWACRVVDATGRLPLHSSIHTFQQDRIQNHPGHLRDNNDDDNVDDDEELPLLQFLLQHYPSALACRDGVTGLLPCFQAAIGLGASLNTIYYLLRLDPVLMENRCSYPPIIT